MTHVHKVRGSSERLRLTGPGEASCQGHGRDEAIPARLKVLLAELERLDASILQFDPIHKVEAIRPGSIRPPRD
jgi:hypothetical protein